MLYNSDILSRRLRELNECENDSSARSRWLQSITLAVGAGQYRYRHSRQHNLRQRRLHVVRNPHAAGAIHRAWTATQRRVPRESAGHPNFNGVWQALNSANWNLEAHSVTGLSQFWQLGAIASIPAGKSVLRKAAARFRTRPKP